MSVLASQLLAESATVAVAREDRAGGCQRRDGAAALAGLGGGVVAEATDRSGAWFGELRDGDQTVLATCEGGDTLTRVLAFALPAVALEAEGEGAPPPLDLRALLEDYFAALREDRFEDAAAPFSPGCLYSHPPYRAGSPRALFRGREGLLRGLIHERGSSPAIQRILRLARAGRWGFIEGVVDGIPAGGTFLSSLRLDADGLIDRYVACHTSPRVPL